MANKKVTILIFCITLLIISSSSYILGQDNSGKQEASYSLLWLIRSSGIIGWIIILLSIVTIALATENIVTLQTDKIIPPDLLQDVDDFLKESSYKEVMDLCDREDNNFFANVIVTALPRLDDGYDSVMDSARNVIEEETVKLQQKISILQLIGSLAPMLGLLGTVWGMIVAFSKIATMEGAPKPKDLAGGIYQALITTCLGLIVAIIALTFYFYFKNKVIRISHDIAGLVEELFDHLRNKEA